VHRHLGLRRYLFDKVLALSEFLPANVVTDLVRHEPKVNSALARELVRAGGEIAERLLSIRRLSVVPAITRKTN
jgi:hypothetical protein